MFAHYPSSTLHFHPQYAAAPAVVDPYARFYIAAPQPEYGVISHPLERYHRRSAPHRYSQRDILEDQIAAEVERRLAMERALRSARQSRSQRCSCRHHHDSRYDDCAVPATRAFGGHRGLGAQQSAVFDRYDYPSDAEYSSDYDDCDCYDEVEAELQAQQARRARRPLLKQQQQQQQQAAELRRQQAAIAARNRVLEQRQREQQQQQQQQQQLQREREQQQRERRAAAAAAAARQCEPRGQSSCRKDGGDQLADAILSLLGFATGSAANTTKPACPSSACPSSACQSSACQSPTSQSSTSQSPQPARQIPVTQSPPKSPQPQVEQKPQQPAAAPVTFTTTTTTTHSSTAHSATTTTTATGSPTSTPQQLKLASLAHITADLATTIAALSPAAFSKPVVLEPDTGVFLPQKNRDLVAYEEALLRLLTRADEVQSEGSTEVRDARKKLVEEVTVELEKVDAAKRRKSPVATAESAVAAAEENSKALAEQQQEAVPSSSSEEPANVSPNADTGIDNSQPQAEAPAEESPASSLPSADVGSGQPESQQASPDLANNESPAANAVDVSKDEHPIPTPETNSVEDVLPSAASDADKNVVEETPSKESSSSLPASDDRTPSATASASQETTQAAAPPSTTSAAKQDEETTTTSVDTSADAQREEKTKSTAIDSTPSRSSSPTAQSCRADAAQADAAAKRRSSPVVSDEFVMVH
ncbi:hypothetical protein HDU90_001563 [Geranomyces variabilis]|nr:hypothetical protein HDU90_001563 [Geranomyces variabilis]